MWTPKRLLLAIAGFMLLFSTYEVYARFLGGLDGLMPLPKEFWPSEVDNPDQPITGPPPNPADIKLKTAFGESCPELGRPVRVEIKKRRMAVSVDDFNPTPEGLIELKPFSIAIFGAPPLDGGTPEINTIRSDVAYLEFDQPIKSPSDISKGKIIAGELRGNIQITNNRKTTQRDDDLSLYTQGPVYYREAAHHIWTQSGVKLIDLQSKPEPTTVTAEGLDVYLTSETAPPSPAKDPVQRKPESFTNVEKVVLRSSVTMHLWVDSRSGFLSSGDKAGGKSPAAPKPAAKPEPTAAKPAAAADKAQVVITTAGPFCYDVTTDKATFDIPLRMSRLPENVQVTRIHDQGRLDQLFCDHLELQFRRKNTAAAKPPSEERGEGLEIESAHATGREVTLTSDAEGLDAFGNDLFYDAIKRHTILKGEPKMFAMKDGNEIYARELWLVSSDKKEAQEALAKGPGEIHLLDRTSGQRNLEAHWSDTLEYKKDNGQEILTLTGDAVFEDKEHAQRMKADVLRVWLEPAGAAPPPGVQEGEQRRLRPQRVEAKGKVRAESPDLRINEPTEDLTIWIKDAPIKPELPAILPEKAETRGTPTNMPAGSAKPAVKEPETGHAVIPGLALPTGNKPAGPAAKGKDPNQKPKPPIDLSARTVKAYVVRTGEKNDLDRLWCEGMVHVHQEPGSPEDRGMDIRGETLDLNHSAEGNDLAVTGQLAQVQLDKITIIGPEVHIDQRTNQAWVNGIGAMQLWSNSTLDGAKLEKETQLTIHWQEKMWFTGKNAEFHGGVQAVQDSARLLCQDMTVDFDRPISLKESDKGKTKPKVDRVVCDKSVQIEDSVVKENRLESYKRLVSPVVAMDNLDKEVEAAGPGEVRILQMTASDELIPKAGPNPAGGNARPANSAKTTQGAESSKQEPKLTHVRYRDRMQANNERRTATFFGNVEVVHVPTDKKDLVIDLDHPPPGCMYLRCEKLNVFTRLLPDGRKSQEMNAQKSVFVQTQEFYALAEVVKYEEDKELIIFEGGEGGMASLYRVQHQAAKQEKVIAKKIYYFRRTGLINVEGGQGINFTK